ncbi:MAG: response regulator [Chitinophagaceae bacterium]|nr:MAG: response regulator [Chitinophagaceae bacterium]
MTTFRIILVENDEDEQLFMREGFEKAGGFEVLAQVNNGEGLLEWLEAHPGQQPDLILSDLNMPGMNGMDIIEAMQLMPQGKKVPVVITSTSSTRSIMDKCLEAGASSYVVKPDTFIHYEPFVHSLYQLIIDKGIVQRQPTGTGN